MLILSLDSTAQTASVALSENDTFLSGVTLNIGNKHSTTLLPAVEFVMKVSGRTVSDIDLFAVTSGPGSFTGVRIGAATVKGLAIGRDVPCIGVSSLETMAEGAAIANGIVCPMINARRDRYFSACFEAENGRITRLSEDDTLEGVKIEEYLNSQYKPFYLIGVGADVFFQSHSVASHIKVPEMLKYPFAYYAGIIAKRTYESSDETEKREFTAENLRPTYLRQPQAERELLERSNNNSKEN